MAWAGLWTLQRCAEPVEFHIQCDSDAAKGAAAGEQAKEAEPELMHTLNAIFLYSLELPHPLQVHSLLPSVHPRSSSSYHVALTSEVSLFAQSQPPICAGIDNE